MYLPSAAHGLLGHTLTPFLYPCLDSTWSTCARRVPNATRPRRPLRRQPTCLRFQSTSQISDEHTPEDSGSATINVNQYDHLNPNPPDYSSQLFTDACTLTVSAGGGGHGCISFLREKYIPNGPANGGDGGTGGSIYIQAVKGETSLHKLARRGILKAGRGKNGQGSLKGGARGEDILLTVPVGTVVREISRHDPLVDEEALGRRHKGYGRDLLSSPPDSTEGVDQVPAWRRDKWLIYPGALPRSFSTADFPALPRPRRSHLTALQPPAPLRLDLEKPMETPLLLAAGAMGGLGNPHFVTKSIPRPKFATKGDDGLRIALHLELKLLADVGLVGLPNAGKSTLLRALTRSRTRVGDWAFTTLSPNIGTVVLDAHSGRRKEGLEAHGGRRTNFTIADIPGLIEDAHRDKGLGLGFLRHVERAAVLAFVIDLHAGDAVEALQALWRELGEYEKVREREVNAETERVVGAEDADGGFVVPPERDAFDGEISPGLGADAFGLLGEEKKGEEAAAVEGEEEDAISAMEATPRREERRREGGRRRRSWSRDRESASPPLSSPPSPLALPAISTKPWLVVATKADLPGTQENYARLQAYLERVQAGEEEHPSCKPNAWRKKLYSVPVSAINKEGVTTLPEIVLQLLDE